MGRLLIDSAERCRCTSLAFTLPLLILIERAFLSGHSHALQCLYPGSSATSALRREHRPPDLLFIAARSLPMDRGSGSVEHDRGNCRAQGSALPQDEHLPPSAFLWNGPSRSSKPSSENSSGDSIKLSQYHCSMSSLACVMQAPAHARLQILYCSLLSGRGIP
jgi:hypothetical protein